MTCLQGNLRLLFDWNVGKKANIYSPSDAKFTASRKVIFWCWKLPPQQSWMETLTLMYKHDFISTDRTVQPSASEIPSIKKMMFVSRSPKLHLRCTRAQFGKKEKEWSHECFPAAAGTGKCSSSFPSFMYVGVTDLLQDNQVPKDFPLNY